MAGRRIIRVPHAVRSRTFKTWLGTDAAAHAFATVAASSAVILSSASILEDITILRTRGILSVMSDQFAATEFQIGAAGIAVVTTAAFTAGIASLPTPVTESSWDGWLWYQSFCQRVVFGTAVGIEPQFVTSYDIDSKAMRKVGPDETIVCIAENASASHGISVVCPIRQLMKVS